MHDAIRRIMHVVERDAVGVVTAQEAETWPPGLLPALLDLGILQETRLADSVWCDECGEGCAISPDLRQHAITGEVVGVHYCSKDGYGRITVSLSQLRQWRCNLDNLAKWVCSLLAFAPEPLPIMPRQLYSLGTSSGRGTRVHILLAYGMTRPPGDHRLEDRLRDMPGAVVIVPAYMPARVPWPGLGVTFLPLADLLSWNAERHSLQASLLVSTVASVCPAVPEEQWITVTRGAELLINDLPFLDIKKAAARISKAAGSGKFMTNGKTRDARRIERVSFDAWRLEQRDRGLDAEEDD